MPDRLKVADMAASVHGREIQIPRKTWVLIGALAASLIIPAWVLLYLLYQFSPNFEHQKRKALERPADVNWQTVHQLGAKAWQQLRSETFVALNSGRWLTLCVNGGHTDPVATFEARVGPGRVPDHLRAQFSNLLAVGDYDLVVSFADTSGGLDMLYFVDGGSLQTRNLAWCARK